MFLAPRLERSRTRTSSYAIKILPARSISEISLPRRDLCGPQPAPGALSSHVLPMPSSSLRSSPALVRSAAFDITLLNSQETLSINHSLNHLRPPCARARADTAERNLISVPLAKRHPRSSTPTPLSGTPTVVCLLS